MVLSIKASSTGPEAAKHHHPIILPPVGLTVDMVIIIWNTKLALHQIVHLVGQPLLEVFNPILLFQI